MLDFICQTSLKDNGSLVEYVVVFCELFSLLFYLIWRLSVYLSVWLYFFFLLLLFMDLRGLN